MADILSLIDKINIVQDGPSLKCILKNIYNESKKKVVRVAFLNAHAINMAYTNQDFYTDLMSCDYLFRDGTGMKIMYFFLGKEAGLNLNGTDLIPQILDLYKGYNISVIGTVSPYLERSAEEISRIGLLPVAVLDGFQAEDNYISAIEQNPADVILLGMGMPKQEYMSRKISETSLKPSLVICGGAILDFWGGKVRRAPKFIRNFGVEWIFRLVQEPRRLFSRYIIGNAVFIYRAFLLSFQRPVVNPSSPKILHVVRQYHPAIGGLEIYVRNMAAYQKKMGYDCTVLTLNKLFQEKDVTLSSEDIIDGIKIHRVSFLGKRRYFLPLVSPFYFRKFDIVHVHNTDVFFDYTSLCAILFRFPAFATTHGGFFHTTDFNLIKKLYFNVITRITSSFYKAIFSISENDYRIFKNMNSNIIMQPNAIEPLGEDIYNGADFLYIGRLSQNKNIRSLLKTFSFLKSKHSIKGKLKIIGPAWDVSVEELSALSKDLGIENDLSFYGVLSPEKIKKEAETCGYFVSASQYEGFGMSMIEAMSVGLIPLVHNNQAFVELVSKSQCGIFVDYDSAEDAANRIYSYLQKITPDLRKKAQEFSLQFSWPSLVKNADEVYKGFIIR